MAGKSMADRFSSPGGLPLACSIPGLVSTRMTGFSAARHQQLSRR